MNQSTLDSRTRLILDKTKPVLRFSEVTDGDNHTYKMHFIQGVGTLHHVYLFDPLIPFLQNPLAQQRAYDVEENAYSQVDFRVPSEKKLKSLSLVDILSYIPESEVQSGRCYAYEPFIDVWATGRDVTCRIKLYERKI